MTMKEQLVSITALCKSQVPFCSKEYDFTLYPSCRGKQSHISFGAWPWWVPRLWWCWRAGLLFCFLFHHDTQHTQTSEFSLHPSRESREGKGLSRCLRIPPVWSSSDYKCIGQLSYCGVLPRVVPYKNLPWPLLALSSGSWVLRPSFASCIPKTSTP